MLKYRINKKEVINNSNIITVENVEDYRTIEEEKTSEIASVDDTFICTFTCKSIDSLNANKDTKNKIYTVHNFSAIDDEGTEYPCNYTYEYEVDGDVVNTNTNTFSLELSKLFVLPTVSIGRVATYSNNVDIEEPIYYMYIYFQNSHLFNRYDNNGDETKIKLYFNCYTLNTIKFFPLEMEYVTPFAVRYKWNELNNNLKALFEEDDKGNINPNGNIYNVEIYRENPLFGVYDNYIIYNNSPVCSINLPLGIKFRTDLQKEQLMADYLTDRRAKSINKINDMEKDVYHPVQWDNEKNEKKNDIYQIIFNLHFREHRYDDWNAAPDSYWNGVIFDANENKFRLMNNSNQEELGYNYFSYNKDDWDRSNQSDLLSYLNFTNEDIRYQKSRLKKSFLRLLFFDSVNPADQNLLAYSTVFIDSGALFSKYVRHFEDKGFSALNYNGDIVLPTSLDLNGIRINREPMINGETYEEFKNELEDVRLSSQFVIKDKYNSTTSSEGFYLYLWRDNDNGIIPSDLYMKVEFNHAGYGRTIPFMMPYEDKDDDNKGKIKTFKEIVEDWSPIKNEDKNENENEDKNKDKYVGYGIKRYLKYSYIHLKYQYDETDKRHVYYVDSDLYKGTDESIYGIDNTMKFDLYEAKINFDSKLTDTVLIEYIFNVGFDSIIFTADNKIKIEYIVIDGKITVSGKEYTVKNGEVTINGVKHTVVDDRVALEYEGNKVDFEVMSYQKKNNKQLMFVVNENGLNWCKWEKNGNTITITAEENNYNRKQGTLILIQEKSNKQIRINVSQEEKVRRTRFEANPREFNNVEDKGGTCEVNVISEYYNGEEIDYTITKDVDWITNISQTPDGFVFDVKANEEATERNAKISLIQDDSEKELTLNVIQKAKPIAYDFYFEDEPTVTEKDETVPYTANNKQYKIVSKDNRDNNIGIILPTNNDIIENINITYVNNGIYNLSFDITQNDDVDVRDASIVLTQETSGKKLTINISQMGDKTIVLPDFDNLILRYNWTDKDGKDFDTMTVINGTGLTINNKKVDDYNVGYGSGNTNSNFVLVHGGDNKTSGDETCLIRMGDICTEENLLTMKTNGVKTFYIDIYGLWWGSKNNGNVTIEMTAYKGGTVSLGDAFKWVVNGGEKVLTTTLHTNVNAFANSSSISLKMQYCKHYKDSYTKIGRVTYNIKTKATYLTLTGVKSGWEDAFELYVSPNLVDISSDGASGTVTIKSSKNESMLNCTIKKSVDWLTVSIEGNKIHYTVRPNEETTNRQTQVEVIQDFTNFNTDLTIKQLGVTE